MFTQAGFNPRRRRVCYAFIARFANFGRSGFWARPSCLVRFECGDYAWDGGGGRISWPEQIYSVCNERSIEAAARAVLDELGVKRLERCELNRIYP